MRVVPRCRHQLLALQLLIHFPLTPVLIIIFTNMSGALRTLRTVSTRAILKQS
jgi:hypothetical protein